MKMKRKQLIKETQVCLQRMAPDLNFRWLNKLKELDLIELHELLLRVLEPDDLVRF